MQPYSCSSRNMHSRSVRCSSALKKTWAKKSRKGMCSIGMQLCDQKAKDTGPFVRRVAWECLSCTAHREVHSGLSVSVSPARCPLHTGLP